MSLLFSLKPQDQCSHQDQLINTAYNITLIMKPSLNFKKISFLPLPDYIISHGWNYREMKFLTWVVVQDPVRWLSHPSLVPVDTDRANRKHFPPAVYSQSKQKYCGDVVTRFDTSPTFRLINVSIKAYIPLLRKKRTVKGIGCSIHHNNLITYQRCCLQNHEGNMT